MNFTPTTSLTRFRPFGVRAHVDYEPHVDTRLDFKKGDLILVTDTLTDSWWYGTLDGRKGPFPTTVVDRIPTLTTEELCRDHASHVRAIFSYMASIPSELSFERGDTTRLIEPAYDDWWKGDIDGCIGIFPLTYVEVLPRGSEPNETILGVVPAQQDLPQISKESSRKSETASPYHAYRPPASFIYMHQGAMGTLAVEILSASKWHTERRYAMCTVSQDYHTPFHSTAIVEVEPLCLPHWHDRFTLGVESRRTRNLIFTLLIQEAREPSKTSQPSLTFFPPDLATLKPRERSHLFLPTKSSSVILHVALTFSPTST